MACDLVASGLTPGLVNSGVNAALSRKVEAGAEDWFTVGSIFMATAPVVLAVIAAAFWIYSEKLQGYSALVAVTACFAAAAVVTNAVIGTQLGAQSVYAANTAASTAPGPFRALGWLFQYFATAYGSVLFVQGLVVGSVAVLAWFYYNEKWQPSPS